MSPLLMCPSEENPVPAPERIVSPFASERMYTDPESVSSFGGSGAGSGKASPSLSDPVSGEFGVSAGTIFGALPSKSGSPGIVNDFAVMSDEQRCNGEPEHGNSECAGKNKGYQL